MACTAGTAIGFGADVRGLVTVVRPDQPSVARPRSRLAAVESTMKIMRSQRRFFAKFVAELFAAYLQFVMHYEVHNDGSPDDTAMVGVGVPLNDESSYVQFKLEMLKRALPANSAIVFGDMYLVDGGYCKKCLDYGLSEVLLVDTLETVNWQKLRIENPSLDFYKGDFSNPHFMRSFDRQFDIGVVYDILLHQAPLLQTLHLMLEKIRHRICIVQPMLREQALSNSLVYLPGNANRDLYPVKTPDKEFQVFDIDQVNHSHWLWGMTVSFLTSALWGHGFEIMHQEEFADHALTDQWILWGCVAERKRANPLHWGAVRPVAGLMDFNW
jgi:hypothetical protein